MSELRPVGEGIARVARLPRPDPVLEAARAAWPQAVGAEVARRSLPVRIKGDWLIVHCESSTWVAELSLMERQVHAGLSRQLAELPGRIRFEVGAVTPPEPPPPVAAPLRAATERDREQARQLAGDIRDEALREAVQRAIEHSLRRDS